MKFAISLLGAVASASQAPVQGYGNKSIQGTFGYGYNMGNGYNAGSGHGEYLGHQEVAGYGQSGTGKYSAPYAHDHLIGYDSVQPEVDSKWTTLETNVIAIINAINTQIDTIHASRLAYIQDQATARKLRLQDIHEMNAEQLASPFELQFDLLSQEIKDV